MKSFECRVCSPLALRGLAQCIEEKQTRWQLVVVLGSPQVPEGEDVYEIANNGYNLSGMYDTAIAME